MTCETIRTRLDDYVDGYLESSDAAAVERHLRSCPDCRREVESIRRLVAAARDLSGGTEPPRNLWPEIAPRLETASTAAAGVWQRRLLLAAAALVLMVLSSAVTVWWMEATSRPESMAVGPEPERPVSVVAELARAEDASLLVRRDLLEIFEKQKESLEPETVAAVEANLRLIDEAIAEIQSALEQDPANRHLRLLLARTYQQEVNLLRKLSRVSENI